MLSLGGRIPIDSAYGFLWVVSTILLGLTGYRVHHTNEVNGTYEPIMVELIICATLAMIWAPVAVFYLSGKPLRANPNFFNVSRNEVYGLIILWIFWLVGAVDTTARILPGRNWCSAAGFEGKQCNVVSSVLAFSWMGWSLITIVLVLCLIYSVAESIFDERPQSKA